VKLLRAASRRAGLAVVLAVLAVPAASLDPSRAVTQYRRDAWNTRQGLPQSSVESVAQTADGYLWLGTQEGLARFDGVRFVVFDKANTPALRHNRVKALLVDRDGSLWIGTEGGGVARLREGAFTALGVAEGLPSPRIYELAQDADGTVWVGTDRGLSRLDDGRFVEGPRDEGLFRRSIEALCAGRAGLWVGLGEGFVHVRGNVVEPGTALGLPPGPVTALWEDADGTLWVGTRHGLFVRPPGQLRVMPGAVSLPGPVVTAIRRDRDGSLWVGTEMGAARLAGAATNVLSTRQGLSNDQVLEIFEDREGSLWIGTQDGGVNRLADGKFTTYSTAEGLAGDIVWPVFGDRAGNVWVGTKTGGLSRFRDGRIQNFSTARGLSNNAVQSIAETPDGALWIGTRGGGLNRFKDGRFTVFSTRQGLPYDSVSALVAARDGGLWVGMRGGGLGRFKDGSFTSWTTRNGLPNDTIHFLLEAKDGSLWIATNGGGLVHFMDGGFRAYTTRDGLSADVVNVLHEDAQGTLWVGTFGGGLNRMHADGFTAYTTAQGLYDDAIFSILEDGQGRLWMSCNKGIFRVDKRELDDLDRNAIPRLRPVAYGVEDGMKNRECNGANQPPAWRDGRGRLWFPTIEGVAVIDPERIRTNAVPPPVSVEQLVVDGRGAGPRDGLVLGPGARNLEFHYVAPSFVVPSRVQYRYSLEGLDPEWVDAGPRRVAYYSRLPPGRFRFRVTAANDDGLWNQEVAALSFDLRPHFYETPWFYAACALAVGGMLWVGDRLRVRGLRAREEALQRLVDERTRALAEANQRLERLSALDPLTGLANRRRFDEVLDVEWRRGCRSGGPISLVLFDLDFFKPYNDTNGHLAGDECLRQVAHVLAGALGRAGDLVARYGGEEFVALLPDLAEEAAVALAERLRAGVEALGLPHPSSSASGVVTISARVASMTADERHSPAALVAAADRALYQAKRGGRNRVIRAAAPAPAH
jgi:diguanylate cyclase (GGDEF)-like protein